MILIIDLEFTGLDNTFIKDNEITQVKLMNADTKQGVFSFFMSKKPVSVYDKVFSGIKEWELYYQSEPVFTKELFEAMLSELGATMRDVFWGYSTSQDMLMLKKYGIEIEINDMQDTMRLCPDYELKLATGAAKMECAYFMLTGKIPPKDTHYDSRELNLLGEMYDKVKELKPNESLSVMPYGHCAGMPLRQYVANFRRAADGYRYNNNDLLSRSLNLFIDEHELDFSDRNEFHEEDDDDF